MNRYPLPLILALALLSACSDAPAPRDPAGGPVVKAVGEAATLKAVLAIDAVDVANRKVTLRGTGGRVGTYSVTPEVKRLSEIHAGDTLLVDYHVAAVAELREPTAEEAKAPLVLSEMIDRRPANQSPGGTMLRTLRTVVEIDAVNATAGTVTLKGPLDGQIFLKVQDASVMSQLKAGRKIVVTFDETMIVVVDPATEKR
ncbi:MAG TPA: hypothetical protein VE981_14410 [Planctomycetota bacterium]|nr:hypothetical protein [Planctomycetota bacterium]